MKISIGFSPCPNDTFIMDALIHKKIPTHGLDFHPMIADVEHLNQAALQSKMMVTKLSYHAFAHCSEHYQMMSSGSALGRNCGPLVISKRRMDKYDLEKGPTAIPGQLTTANMLFSLALPLAKNKVEMLFSDIEESILLGEMAAGVIIHENRFTYRSKGLQKVMDLGSYWEDQTSLPIPLGGIAIQRSLDEALKNQIESLIRESVVYAFEHPLDSRSYVLEHAQELSEEVCRQHIDLYVNKFSVDLGVEGHRSVELLLKKAIDTAIIEKIYHPIFLH